jgi:hypothetical protein
MLDRVRRNITVSFGPGAGNFTSEYRIVAFCPADILRCVHGSFHIGAVEVGVCTRWGINELCWERERIPEDWTLLDDFVNIEAGIHFECCKIDQIENIAICVGGVIEVD